jgi:hypothetical protein
MFRPATGPRQWPAGKGTASRIKQVMQALFLCDAQIVLAPNRSAIIFCLCVAADKDLAMDAKNKRLGRAVAAPAMAAAIVDDIVAAPPPATDEVVPPPPLMEEPVAAAAAAEEIGDFTDAVPETVAAESPLPMLPSPVAMAALPMAAAEQSRRGAKDLGEETLVILGEAQAAFARVLEAMTVEMTGLARAGIAAATETATAMLSAKTLADAVEINAGFARRSVDALIGSSAKLSEIGIRFATDASRPVLARLGEDWHPV